MTHRFNGSPVAKILVVGDIILDRYVHGDTTRISPEAPVPVVKVNRVEERPGGAANVAMNIASLGLQVELLGITGKDESADILETQMTSNAVVSTLVRCEGFPTVTKLRVLSQNQQLLRLDYESSQAPAVADEVQAQYARLLTDVQLVVISDYAKGSLQSLESMIKAAREKEIPVLVDPKGSDFSRYRQATVLTPNLNEFLAVVGECGDESEFDSKALELCKNLELDALLVTRGRDGMTLYTAEKGKLLHQPALAHEVFDVTGAGDSVIGVLAASLVSSHSLEEAVIFANTAAGLVVEKLGAASVSVDELNSALANRISKTGTSGVYPASELVDIVQSEKDKGATIVMTNGCFDVLHAGHVDYLEKARQHGDYLVVAVNNDASVERLKGKGRPVNTLGHRMKVLSALASTDWICSFAEDTPEALIHEICPDVLVKGADYEEHEIVGADFVKTRGGRVERIAIEIDTSSSEIINSINLSKMDSEK